MQSKKREQAKTKTTVFYISTSARKNNDQLSQMFFQRL